MELSGKAKQVVQSRYALHEKETWDKTAERVGCTIATHDVEYRDHFSQVISDLLFLPGGRILRNAGRPRGSLFNCYHLPIGDSIEEIGQYIKDSLILWSEGGGVGCNFSTLRPRGDIILGKGGESSGLVSFMEATDGVSKTIESGGARRAAALGQVHVSHPEILDFIDAKVDKGKLSGFNISVAVNDDFLAAVERGDDWTTSFNGRSYLSMPARELWDRIVTNMHKHAEPGLLNWDYFTKNNSYYFAPILGTNPCFSGDTLIETVHGPIPIRDLTDETYVYSMDSAEKLCIRKASASWVTQSNVRTKCLVLSTGETLTVTADHKIYTLNRGYVEAQSLKRGDQLNYLHRIRRGAKYSGVRLTSEGNKNDQMEHRFVYAGVHGPIPPEFDVHHINGDTYDNRIENLECIHHSSHATLTRLNCKNDHQVQCPNTGRFVRSGKSGVKAVVPLPEHLKSPTKITGWVRIVDIIDGPITDVYDISVEGTHCLIANRVVAHNCGETCLEAYGVCNLGSLVLPNFLTAGGQTKWSELERVIYLAVRFLDNVIDVNKYALKPVEINANAARRVGLGVMGLAEYLFAKKVRYGSEASINVIERLFKFIRNTTYEASVRLAREKGTFPKFDSVAYGKAHFIRTLPASLRREIKTHGVRNCTLMAMAPTGTISLIPECQSGIEPLFAKAMKRSDRVSERLYVHPLYKECIVNKEEIPDYLVDTQDLSAVDHLEVQAVVQKYTDCSVSKTINLPEDTSIDGLSDLLLESIHDLKGVTVYRDGSRDNQILTRISEDEIQEYFKVDTPETHMESDQVQCATGSCEI